MCLFPKLVENPKYKPNQKNGGIIPPIKDKRTTIIPVSCGNCMECMKKKARNWNVRLHEELKVSKNAYFVTWTFNNESLDEIESKLITKDINGKQIKLKGYELDNAVAGYAVRHYLENWRSKHKKSLRHWIVSELGQDNTERIHLHGIVWTDKKEEIIKRWKYGHVYIGEYVNGRTVNYITKYLHKTDEKHKYYKPKMWTSKGIGSNFLNEFNKKKYQYKGEQSIEHYKTSNGNKMALPEYYRRKLYDDEEREQLWINKIDQHRIWIDGQEVDISKDLEQYHKTMEIARKKNKRLGYKDDKIDKDEKNYEINLRIINKLKRENKRK